MNKKFFVPHVDQNFLNIKMTHLNPLRNVNIIVLFKHKAGAPFFICFCMRGRLALSNMAAMLKYNPVKNASSLYIMSMGTKTRLPL